MNAKTYKVGDAVVVTMVDGAKWPATITHVSSEEIYASWYPAYAQPHTVYIPRRDWSKHIAPGGAK